MKKIFTAALLLMMLLVTGCGGGGEPAKTDGGDSKEVKKIVIGLDDEYAPMGFKNEQNEIIGFDVDLATEAAKRMISIGTAKRRSLNRDALTLSGMVWTLRPNVRRTCFSANLTWTTAKSSS